MTKRLGTVCVIASIQAHNLWLGWLIAVLRLLSESLPLGDSASDAEMYYYSIGEVSGVVMSRGRARAAQ